MSGQEQIIRYLLIFLEYFSFFYVIFRKRTRKISKRNIVMILACCMLVIIGMRFQLELEENITPFSTILLIVFIILYYIFDISVIEMIGLALEQWLMISMIELSLYVVFEQHGLKEGALDNIVMLSIMMFLWLYYIVIGRRIEPYLFQVPIKVLYLLDFIMFILTAMMEFFSYIIVMELTKSHVVAIGKLLVMLGGSLICILLVTMVYFYNHTQMFRVEKSLAELQNEQQREYFQQLLNKEEETKKFRHDIVDDLLAMQNYCKKQDYDKLEMYLKSTLGVIENISKENYDIGNDIINTVLNYYLKPVRLDYVVEVSGYVDDKLPIEQRDLCIISSNLIRNAVEAVEKQESGKIVFEVKEGKKYLSIKVENTFDGNLELGKDGLPKTTKDDAGSHGIGLQNVKKIVDKYDGRWHVDVNDNKYQMEIFFKV